MTAQPQPEELAKLAHAYFKIEDGPGMHAILQVLWTSPQEQYGLA